MDNLGDWIYILFILIAFITSVFKPKKRSQKTNRPLTPAVPAPAGSSSDASDSRWQELTAGRRRPVSSPPPFPAEAVADPYEHRIRSTASPKKEIKTDACYQLDENAYGETEENGMFRNQADLRKAVIAAEILGRKF